MRSWAHSVAAEYGSRTGWPGFIGRLSSAFGWVQNSVERGLSGWRTKAGFRRLRVAETVSLGEKRFLSIVEVDGERLLIGGGPGEVRLLKSLETFSGCMKKREHLQDSSGAEG